MRSNYFLHFFIFFYILYTKHFTYMYDLYNKRALDNFYKWYDQEIDYVSLLIKRFRSHKLSHYTHTSQPTQPTSNYTQYILRLSFLLNSIEQLYLHTYHSQSKQNHLVLLINNIKLLIHYIQHLHSLYPSFPF